MNPALILFLALFSVILFGLVWSWRKDRERLGGALGEYGVDLGFYIVYGGYREGTSRVWFNGRSRLTGDKVSGTARVRGAVIKLQFKPPFDRKAHLRHALQSSNHGADE